MKIAIVSEKKSLDARIDNRFGRCAYFAIYDSDSKTTEFFPNPAKDSPEGAGPEAVKFIASKGVKKVVAPEYGRKAEAMLNKLQIEMVQDKDKTISDIIKELE
ncbi:MAG: NifB/NifX family molybdenum-iron cluster-binding protein [Bacteroidota bacterium]|jgi:predicted Fe-Mo cluster-binding NifX family protein|nr:NifB/NifX family molybdenum-iron cluster-binding protein [Bacteroidota bacterium]HHU97955.1 dinitrogenase iron-molybdenum cofactor biosynthesis protein [Petrimonas sp.]